MRVIFIFLIFFNLLMAESKKVEAQSSELRMIVELIKLNNEAMNKRFESVDKRFEDMQRYMDKRFDSVDKRFESVDKRFEDMQRYMDKRFDSMFTFLGVILTVMVAGFGIIITYLIKERSVVNSVQKDLKIEVEKIDNSLKKKADKRVVEKIIEIVERLAKDDIDIQDMLKKHHLSYQG